MMYQSLQNTGVMRAGEDDEDLRLLLIGKTGSGKSATGNTIFNDRVFESEMSCISVTRVCQTHTDVVNNRRVTVIDTPDFRFSTDRNIDSDSELKKALELCSPGAHVILLILSLSTFTEQEKDFIDWFKQKFGQEALRFTLVLFTHADQRHMRSLGEMIRGNTQLSDFINRCGQRYYEFNIKAPANRWQVTELVEKIIRLVFENRNSCYTLKMMLENERRSKEEERRAEEEKRREEEMRTEEEMRERRREDERRKREHQMQLVRVRTETEKYVKTEFEQKLQQEKAKILENKEKAKNRVEHSLLSPIKLKYVGVFMVCAVVTGGVLMRKEGSSHGWTFITGGLAAAAGVIIGICWKSMWKIQNKTNCSSSHKHSSTVRLLFLNTVSVVCGSVFARAVISHIGGEKVLSVLAGAAGAFTAIHWSS